ncbi:MAG: prepilin-type N-terminal cleavage/methylation domain-containing protein, partial [Patescibacteria group bacterium]
MKTKKIAFTLIELLVVIAIIGILATVSIISLTNARAKSRDAKRAGDMKQVQTALELFFNDKNRYPTAAEWSTGQIFSTSTIGTSTYMQVVPSAPTPADGTCSVSYNSYNYMPIDDGNKYCVDFCVGGVVGQLNSGQLCLTPAGILNGSCCGKSECSPIVYGSQSYNTVKIGDQCWFQENLDYGTRIDAVNNQTDADSGVFEKYCYNNLDANCTV